MDNKFQGTFKHNDQYLKKLALKVGTGKTKNEIKRNENAYAKHLRNMAEWGILFSKIMSHNKFHTVTVKQLQTTVRQVCATCGDVVMPEETALPVLKLCPPLKDTKGENGIKKTEEEEEQKKEEVPKVKEPTRPDDDGGVQWVNDDKQ